MLADAYRVEVNDEAQYSLYAADWELSAGWSDAGFTGSREACLAPVESVWTDMRPASLCRQMAETGR